MSDVKVYARWVKIFSLVFVFPFVCFDYILTWFFDKLIVFFPSMHNGSSDYWLSALTSLPVTHRLLGMLFDSISLFLLLLGLRLLVCLLNLYQEGHIFLPHAFQLLRKISKIAFIWLVYVPINRTLHTLILTLHNPPGHRVLEFGISSIDAYHIFFVALLWVITSLMHEACKLKNDLDLTI